MGRMGSVGSQKFRITTATGPESNNITGLSCADGVICPLRTVLLQLLTTPSLVKKNNSFITFLKISP
jgi:hypothetical protein